MVLTALDVILPNGYVHLSTTWEVAEDPDFINKIVDIQEDTNNLTTIEINKTLVAGRTYYSRARFQYNTGFSEYAETKITIAENVVSRSSGIDMPAIINVPVVYTVYDGNNHPDSMFSIRTSDYLSRGNSRHLATTWILENSDGGVIYYNEADRSSLKEITLDFSLPRNELYVMKVMHHGTNRDVSSTGAVSFYVSDSEIELLTDLDYATPEEDLELLIRYADIYTTIEYKLYENDEMVMDYTTNQLSAIVDNSLLSPNNRYMIEITAFLNTDMKEKAYFHFETEEYLRDYLPGNLPYKLG